MELIDQILLFLPVKSLLRFKSVSKSWYSLVKSPKFINQHLKYASEVEQNRRIILKHCLKRSYQFHVSVLPDNKDSEFDLSRDVPVPISLLDSVTNEQLQLCNHGPMLKKGKIPVKFYGPCKGIICVLGDKQGDLISLWNPATREAKRLPALSEERIIHPRFPPGHLPTFIAVQLGFGFDSKTNDFKVVRILDYADLKYGLNLLSVVEVYNVSTGRWRKIDVFVPGYLDRKVEDTLLSSIYLDGVYYWCSNNSESSVIVSFDFEHEMFDLIHAPDHRCMPTMVKYKESLAIVLAGDNIISPERPYFSQQYHALWVLDRGNKKKNTWVQLFKVDGCCWSRTILGFVNNGDAIRLISTFGNEDEHEYIGDEYFYKLETYDHTSQQFKDMHDYDALYDGTKLQVVVDYVESLVSFNELDTSFQST